jgi:flagellar motor switch protein FliM
MSFDPNINGALILLDRALEEIENGFVACAKCGDQEDTKTLDFVDDLKAVKEELLTFLKLNK